MTSYRTLHRHKQQRSAAKEGEVDPLEALAQASDPIWTVEFSPCHQPNPRGKYHGDTNTVHNIRFLTSSSGGNIQGYLLQDKSTYIQNDANAKDTILDASALQMKLTQRLLPSAKTKYTSDTSNSTLPFELGSACLSIVRNYLGDDVNAGSEVTASLRLDGYASIWIREEQPLYLDDDKGGEAMEISRPKHEFLMKDAVGSTMVLLPPRLTGNVKMGICMLIGCLDGSVAIVTTGVAMHNPQKADASKVISPGKTIDSVGSGNAVPMSIALQPSNPVTFAVGRKNGMIDIYTNADRSGNRGIIGDHEFSRMHRLTMHAGSIIRSLAFTPDGNLLISGCDGGDIYIHDTSSFEQNQSVRLVSGVQNAHSGYVLSITCLPDSRRFISSSTDKTVKVWNVTSPKPLHTFDTGHENMVWGVSSSPDGKRFVSCDDDGLLQIHSCQE